MKSNWRDAFINPDIIRETGIDSILKYAASTLSEEIDGQVVDGLRNFLFGDPGQGGLDLASLNIQRGRDHGLADYNTVREYYGLPRGGDIRRHQLRPRNRKRRWSNCTASVDNIDLWVGALAEDHVPGASVGELTRTILADQFQRLRDGDRYFYQNVFSGRQLAQLESTSLADIIRRNTTVTNIQDNVFFLKAQVQGEVYFDTNDNGTQDRREPGLPDIQVDLLNDEGDVVATTLTGRGGRYQFDQFRETGDYRVRVALPRFMSPASEILQEVLISAGDVTVVGVDFGVHWDFRNMLGGHGKTTKNPTKIVDTVFNQMGQSAQQASQSATPANVSTENASDSGDASSGLLDDSGNEAQAGRDQLDPSNGTDFTLRPVRRGPVVSRASR